MSAKMENQKPHAVVMPLPSQGHITPLLKLAKLLHHKGFIITFVNTEIIHQRILHKLHYETVDSGQDVTAVIDAVRNKLPVYFKKLVLDINEEACGSDDLSPISCIVSDGFMSFTLGVTNVLVWPLNASSAMAYANFGQLIENGLVPLPGIIDLPPIYSSHLKN